MKLLVVATNAKDPGRLYRPMFCKHCGDVRLQAVDFISGERTEKGHFVWFKRRCTGLEPNDTARRRVLLRLMKACQKETHDHMPRSQWETFIKGSYY